MSIRVLVVDDSAISRTMLKRGLEKHPNIEVVGTANDAFDARDKIISLKPDVLTLDVIMPKINGIDFLKRIMQHMPLPIIIVSSHGEKGSQVALDALMHGAFDCVRKPDGSVTNNLDIMINDLSQKICNAAKSNIKKNVISHSNNPIDNAHFQEIMEKQKNKSINDTRGSFPDSTRPSTRVIAIGASTGGTEALKEVLTHLPAGLPGIVCVQHMPPHFTRMFAQRLDRECSGPRVKEAEHGDIVRDGCCYIAPGGDLQMRLKRASQGLQIELVNTEKVDGHCPSATYLFNSVAQLCGRVASGVILTGMGKDGASGLLAMKQTGAKTLGQDEASCVVYGMPKMAWECGAVDTQLPLNKIADEITKLHSS